MRRNINKPKLSKYLIDETKQHSLIRFIGLVIIVISYFIFISIKFGANEGIPITILTWTFFIFCTPIADAGFLLAFPVRLLTGLRMIYTQLFSFVLALGINLYTFFITPSLYNKTMILNLFHRILSQPFPFWGIIILSLTGTLFSIYFGDELVDVSSHKQRKKYHKHLNKYQIIIFLFIISATILLYNSLLEKLNINIPL
ncbi:MAG: hypothetical protein GWO87_02780 [Xanthomonadaceae bacterium]|nr:hypothetical protein [Rhodospirillaceae bacterium]NIA18086.1 hypothetical protein [Xanthomonadaceae bacterium]